MPTFQTSSNSRFAQIAGRAACLCRDWRNGDGLKSGKIDKSFLFCQFQRKHFLLTLVATFCTAAFCGALGCSFHQKPKLPVVLKENPTAADLIAVVNKNGEEIQSLYSSNATVGAGNAPGWAACQVAYQKPGNFRLIGTAALSGRVVDCGCNGERFWIWNKFQEEDELYYCRLDQYQGSAFARVLPIDPTWFPEAIGILDLKENEIVDGPTEQNDGSLLITSKKTRPDGDYIRRTYFDAKTAEILRQDVQNPNGETIVTVRCKESQLLEESGLVLPRKLEIFSPATNETLIVDLGTPTVNDSEKIAENAFKQPTDLKATAIDLGVKTNSNDANSSNPENSASSINPTNAAPLAVAQPQAETPSVVQRTGLPIDATNRSVPIVDSVAAQPQTEIPPVVQRIGLPIDATNRSVPIVDSVAAQSTANDALAATAPTRPSNTFYSNQAATPNASLPPKTSEQSVYSDLTDNSLDLSNSVQPSSESPFASPNGGFLDYNATGDVSFPTAPNVAAPVETSRPLEPTRIESGAPTKTPLAAPANDVAAQNFIVPNDGFNDYANFIAPNETSVPDAFIETAPIDAPQLIGETRAANETPRPFVVDAPPATSAPVPIVVDYPTFPQPTRQSAVSSSVRTPNRAK